MNYLLSVLKSPEMSIFCGITLPTYMFVSINQHFFAKKQILISFATMLILAVLACFASQYAFALIESYTLGIEILSHQLSAVHMIGTALSLGIFYILNERFFTDITNKKIIYILFATLILCSLFFSSYIINSIYVIILLSSSLDMVKHRNTPKKHFVTESLEQSFYTTDKKYNITLKEKPNIYFLLLESYHSADALREIYNIDDTDTDNFFLKNNFVDYKNVFANRAPTTESLSTTFRGMLVNPLQQRDAYAIDILRENGYSCEFFDNLYSLYHEYRARSEYFSCETPHHITLLYAFFGPIWSQSAYTRKCIGGYNLFDDERRGFQKICDSFAKRISLQTNEPRFFALRFGAGHATTTQLWKPDFSEFAKRYEKMIFQAQKQIQQIVNVIVEHDKNPLIIALGDHGGLNHFSLLASPQSASSLANYDISLQDIATDLFAVRCSIRWTNKYIIPDEIISPVNIFRYVFDSLGSGQSIYTNKAENISLVPHTNYKILENGTALSKIVPYKATKNLQELEEKINSGKAIYDDYIDLALIFRNKDTVIYVQILQKAIATFPKAADAHYMLGEVLWAIYQYDKSLEHYKIAAEQSSNEQYTFTYLRNLIEISPKDVIIFVESNNHYKNLWQSHLIYMQALIKTSNDAKFHKNLDYFLKNHKYNESALTPLAIVLTSYSEHAKSIEIIENNPKLIIRGQAYIYNSMIINYCMMQQWDAAEKLLQELCTVHKVASAWTWLFYAYVLEMQGKIKNSILELQNACDLVSNNFEIKGALGNIALRHNFRHKMFIPHITTAKTLNLQKKDIIKSKLPLDNDWYIKQAVQAGITEKITDPTLHYITIGTYLGLNPNKWFSTLHYLQYLNVWHNGSNPFVSFLNTDINSLPQVSLYHSPVELFATNAHLNAKEKQFYEIMNAKWDTSA